MITDTDIKKLKAVFDTKQESKKRHVETIKRLDRLDERVISFEEKTNKRFDSIDETLGDMTNALGAIFEWTDDVHRAIVGKPFKRSSGN